MTTEALILFLQHHPDLLLAAKQYMAQALGVDAGQITDQRLFDRLRQDPALAAKAIDALRKHGYDLSNETIPASEPQTTLLQSLPQVGQSTMQSLIAPQNGPCPAGYVLQQGGASSPAASTTLPQAGAQGQFTTLPQAGAQSQSTTLPQAGAQSQSTMLPQAGAQSQSTMPLSGAVCVPVSTVPSNQTVVQPPAAQPATQQRSTPYSYMPSLTDLYTQMLPPDNSTLQRFGSNVFVYGTGNTDTLPMDLPAGPDYVLGPGDNLNVNIWGSQSITLSAVVDRQGEIALPESGSVAISGMTIGEAQIAIQKNLTTQFKDMHVEISLGRVRTVRVYVVGDVLRPGAYDISSLSTPLNALFAAGGPTATGSLRILRHFRGKQLVNDIDLYDFLLRGVRTSIEKLLPGDTIMVPPYGPQVTINGMVRRPAIYELKGGETLRDALEMAGGVMVSASLQQLSVERVEAHQRRTMLNVQFPAEKQSADPQSPSQETDMIKEANRKVMASFQMQDGDAVLVHPILPYNEAAVFLDGHVFRPGKYPYWEGMTVNDLIHNSQDIMPEPADRMELVRLNGADYHPETTLLNLQDVLRGNSPILLKPFDYLRVFSRYEVDSPNVTIVGDVIRPGAYPLSHGMTVSGLVQMAGGFRRSAYRALADLATYTVEDGKKVLLQSSVIDLDKAMSGDPTADVKLKDGELLSIREITGWQDIGSSVAVTGEVGYAGTYGIVAGERLSSVIKRAGGLRDTAYPEGIVLERTTVREMNEKARTDMIQRIQSFDLSGQVMGGLSDSAQQQAETFQMMRAQQQEALQALRSSPPSGRIVVKIGKDISKWENTARDPEMRADDMVVIPKRNDFVVVVGQVYDQTSFSYLPSKTVRWYLQQAGGTNRNAAKRDIYVIRADGSHISRDGLFGANVLSTRLRPGDAIIVPEKLTGTPLWKDIFSVAESMTAPAMLAAISLR